MGLSNLFRTKLIPCISLVLVGASLQFVNFARAQEPAPSTEDRSFRSSSTRGIGGLPALG